MKNRFHSVIGLLMALCVLSAGLFVSGCGQAGTTAGQPAALRFHCPMHPTYTSDRQGDCPICNMKLVPIKGAQSATPTGETDAEAPAVPGRTTIAISPEKQQTIGLRTAVVEKHKLGQTIRTTAAFEHAETKLAKIAPRFAGWVRDLKINFTGQAVEKGDPLLTVYSPELFAAENEYLLAYRRLAQPKSSVTDLGFASPQRLVESARRRLTLWQIGDEEISALEKSGVPKDELLIRSPVSGHVISKTAVEGKAFTAGETLFEIGALTPLWLRTSVTESDMPLIQLGQKARVILPYLGNKTYESKITFLYPHLEAQTRRAEVRLEVDNPNHELRPQMWANVEIEAGFGEVLAAPASAVIDTGERYVAFVLRDDGHLEPREVKIGTKTDDWWEVKGGLKEGEKVVTRALFLVDSESQLKAAIAGMSGSHQHDAVTSKQPAEAVSGVLAQYTKIQTALAADSLVGVAEAAQSIAKILADEPMKMPALASQAGAVADAKDIAAVRERFKPLSASLIQFLKQEKVKTGKYSEVYCDMAKASWLQTNRVVKNPYYGREMLECGEITKSY
ncbi:MAG: efflux RND transporter periplasmic adaptor subunit [Verrucomicrobiia bacterium]|jgi:Cu(I)/Ag(I) efflux system membrane fusion protein